MRGVDKKHEAERSPWHMRAWGYVLVLFGAFNILGSVAVSDVRLEVLDWLILLTVSAAGLGLIGEYRWAWLLGIMLGVLAVVSGIWSLLDATLNGLDITLIGLPYVAFFIFIVPGGVLLLSLLAPSSRRWQRSAQA